MTEITGLLPAVDYVPEDERLRVLWLDACRLQMTALERDTPSDWTAAARAWAAVARACPEGAARDRAIFWTLAGQCTGRARHMGSR